MRSDPVDILLVEDSPDDAAFFMHALKEAKLSAEILHAPDGVEARSLLFGSNGPDSTPLIRPRVVLMDLKMPRMDGVEVLRMLKTNPHTRSIPVVILSSSQEKRDLALCYELGANSYLVKPMDFDDFNETARQVIRYWLHLNHSPS